MNHAVGLTPKVSPVDSHPFSNPAMIFPHVHVNPGISISRMRPAAIGTKRDDSTEEILTGFVVLASKGPARVSLTSIRFLIPGTNHILRYDLLAWTPQFFTRLEISEINLRTL